MKTLLRMLLVMTLSCGAAFTPSFAADDDSSEDSESSESSDSKADE